jgi:hypothetical protein
MSQLQAEQIMSALVASCGQSGQRPLSLAAFAREVQLPLADIRCIFPGLLQLDQAIFRWFWDETVRLIQADDNYTHYSVPERLLTFYYTLFALLTANQTYVQLSLTLPGLPRLTQFQQIFEQKLATVIGLGDATATLSGLRTRLTTRVIWLQFLTLLAFWLQDRSEDHARSDALVETSVAALFELQGVLQFRQTAAWLRFWAEEWAARQQRGSS